MDAMQLLAVHTWSDASTEGVLAVGRDGRIHMINTHLRELFKLKGAPETVDELLAQLAMPSPELRSLLAPAAGSSRMQWGNLVVQRYPPQRLTWQQMPLLEDDEVAGTLTIFRDAATQGQLELAKQSFLSMISHDLRTPLSTILGFAELLYHNSGNLSAEEQTEFLEHIIKNANQLSQYTQIALDIMFLEANLQQLEVETIALDSFFNEWLADAHHRVSKNYLVLKTKTTAQLFARFAPAALHKILHILVEFAMAESPDESAVNLYLTYDTEQAHIVVEHLAPQLTESDAASLFQLMHPRDLSETGRPRLHRMQVYVASLLAQRQQGYLTLHVLPNRWYQIDLTLPLAPKEV